MGGVVHVFQAEQGDHVADGVRIGICIDARCQPVGIGAHHVALQGFQVAAIAEFQVPGGVHRVFPHHEVIELTRFIGAPVDVHREGHGDFGTLIHHGFAFADIDLALIFIGMGFLGTVGFQDGNGVILEGQALRSVNEVAVKGVAAIRKGGDGLLAVQIAGDRSLQGGRHRGGGILAHDRADIVCPEGVPFLCHDGIKQADIAGAVLAGDVRPDAQLRIGEDQLGIAEGRHRHGILLPGLEQRILAAVAGLDNAVRVQHTVFIEGDETAHRTVVADDLLLSGLLRALSQDLHMLDILQVIRHGTGGKHDALSVEGNVPGGSARRFSGSANPPDIRIPAGSLPPADRADRHRASRCGRDRSAPFHPDTEAAWL